MELRNLITFTHVAELGNFTKAAEILGYSQSTVSFQIRQLEQEKPLMLEALPLSLEEIFIYELGGEHYAVKEIIL